MPVDTPPRVQLPYAPQLGPSFLAPEEPILKKYNGHHELPLSLAVSVGLHVLVLLGMALAGVWFFSLADRPRPVDDIREMLILPFDTQEGNGAKGEDGGLPDATEPPKENLHYHPEKSESGILNFNPADLQRTDDTLPLPGMTTNEPGHGLDPSRRPGPTGSGPPGKIGNALDPRLRRRDRWTLLLPMADSAQFFRKLAELDALVLVPSEGGQYRLFDLTKPKETARALTLPEVNRLGRIWYTNRMAVVCQAVADELGLPGRPEFFAIFIPRELEAELLRQELAYRGLSEEEIIRRSLVTSFDVGRQAGRWQVTVRQQQPRD